MGAPGEDAGEGVATGAGVGAAIGGLGGLLVGIGALAIPGIGPVLAAGPIASALIGMGVGAVTGGLIGALVDAGVPEEQASLYAEGIRRGGTLVKVTTSEDRSNDATRIMDRFNPVDIDQRATSWRSEEWSRFDPNATPYTQSEFERERSRYSTDLGREVGQERSRIHTYGTERAMGGTAYDEYDPLFRTHYQTTYGSTGRSYEEYGPAYLYGYELARNPQYRNRTWDQVETDARRSWESEHDDTLWEDIKDAVREAWMRVTGQY